MFKDFFSLWRAGVLHILVKIQKSSSNLWDLFVPTNKIQDRGAVRVSLQRALIVRGAQSQERALAKKRSIKIHSKITDRERNVWRLPI